MSLPSPKEITMETHLHSRPYLVPAPLPLDDAGGSPFQRWGECLVQLMDRLNRRNPVGSQAELARRLLLTLPLAGADFALARIRLGNLQAYAAEGEWGAALFEGSLLRNVGEAER